MVRTIAADVSGDRRERLAALFDTHSDRLYRLARRLTATADDARDLVQETFLRVTAARKPAPVGAADEEAWLVRVLVNIRRDQWRKSAARKRLDEIHWHAQLSNEATDCESELIARTTIWRALDLVPPRRRAVLILHELEGLTIPAIASLLGITSITVRWHLSKGRDDLKRALTASKRKITMRTVGDLLRAADPVRREPMWSALDRLDVRQLVSAGPSGCPSESSRRSVVIAIATVCLAAIAGVSVPRFLSSPLQAAAVRFEIRLAEELPAPGLQTVIMQSGQAIYLDQDVIATNEDILDARVVPGDTPSTFGIEVTFNSRGAETMSRATSNHLGKPVVMLIDGGAVTARQLCEAGSASQRS